MRTPLGRHFDNPDELHNWASECLVCMAILNAVNRSGVTAELLKGPATAEVLASKASLPADKLGRMLDFLVGHEFAGKDSEGRFFPTRRTALLPASASLIAIAEYTALAASKLLPALREDKTPFQVHFGEPVFSYLDAHAEEAAIFGDFMGFMTRRVERFLYSQTDFKPFGTVADLGGSMGDLLLGVLEHYPGTHGILFDRPEVVELARPRLAASMLADRITLTGGSFFESVPAADFYILKQILHDWHDDECCQILRNVRSAINPGGRLAVIDQLLADAPAADEGQMMDVAMMVWDTGRERRVHDFEKVFAATGFRLERVIQNPAGQSVIEAVPV